RTRPLPAYAVTPQPGWGAAGPQPDARTRNRGDGTVFRVGVFGPLVVRSEAATVQVPAPKQRVILATLALRAGQVLSYDELAEIVWDGAPPAAARVAIRNYVKRLRHVLAPVAGRRILTRDPGYVLDAVPDEVDALRFTALCMKAGEAVRNGDQAGGRRRRSRPISGRGACWWTSSAWSPAASCGICSAGFSPGIPAWPPLARP